jgi:hypothetical protein
MRKKFNEDDLLGKVRIKANHALRLEIKPTPPEVVEEAIKELQPVMEEMMSSERPSENNSSLKIGWDTNEIDVPDKMPTEEELTQLLNLDLDKKQSLDDAPPPPIPDRHLNLLELLALTDLQATEVSDTTITGSGKFYRGSSEDSLISHQSTNAQFVADFGKIIPPQVQPELDQEDFQKRLIALLNENYRDQDEIRPENLKSKLFEILNAEYSEEEEAEQEDEADTENEAEAETVIEITTETEIESETDSMTDIMNNVVEGEIFADKMAEASEEGSTTYFRQKEELKWDQKDRVLSFDEVHLGLGAVETPVVTQTEEVHIEDENFQTVLGGYKFNSSEPDLTQTEISKKTHHENPLNLEHEDSQQRLIAILKQNYGDQTDFRPENLKAKLIELLNAEYEDYEEDEDEDEDLEEETVLTVSAEEEDPVNADIKAETNPAPNSVIPQAEASFETEEVSDSEPEEERYEVDWSHFIQSKPVVPDVAENILLDESIDMGTSQSLADGLENDNANATFLQNKITIHPWLKELQTLDDESNQDEAFWTIPSEAQEDLSEIENTASMESPVFIPSEERHDEPETAEALVTTFLTQDLPDSETLNVPDTQFEADSLEQDENGSDSEYLQKDSIWSGDSERNRRFSGKHLSEDASLDFEPGSNEMETEPSSVYEEDAAETKPAKASESQVSKNNDRYLSVDEWSFVFDTMKEQVEYLKKQLEIKDHQLQNKDELIRNFQILLKNEQDKFLKLEHKMDDVVTQVEERVTKKGFFSRLWKR